MIKRSLLVGSLALAGLLALAAPAMAQQVDHGNQEGGLWLPWAASDYAWRIDFMYKVIFWTTAAMFLLTEGLLIAFCIVYRRRPGHRPQYTHGNHTAEIAWTVVPGLMLLGIAVWQIPHWNYIKQNFPKPGDAGVTTVDVMGEQYKWHFRYPGTKAKYKGEDDIKSTGVMRVPFGDKVLCNLRSKDVIHSFFVPHLRVKQDAVPGLRQRAWFNTNRIKLVEVNDAQGNSIAGTPDPDGYKKPDGAVRMLQPFKWVHSEKEIVDPSGPYYNEKIALNNYAEVDGRYGAIVVKASGQPKKVLVLHKGKVSENEQPWKDCRYALGIFEIACAELCGMGHYTMRSNLIVEPRVSFEAWMQGEADSPTEIPAFKFWKD